MTRGTFFIRGTYLSCALKTYISCRIKKMASRFQLLPQLQQLLHGNGSLRSTNCRTLQSEWAVAANSSRRQNPASQLRPAQCIRHSSSGRGWGGGDEDRNRFPVKLMDFPERTMPDFVKSFRNRFFTFLIRGYYDATFSIEGFLEGATQAATLLSSYISEGNFADLKGLVVDEAIQEIQNNYADLTFQQRKWLRVIPSDVIGKFVYEIGMMFDDDTDQRFVEITVVLHGYHDLANSDMSLTDLYSRMEEHPDRFYVCNYRFIREFTKGVESSWTVNKLNHFLPFVPPEDEGSTRL